MSDDTRGRATEPEQLRALAQTFLVRFFDNEITSGTNDLKQSFFHLAAFLAVPGLFYPVILSMDWALTARIRGVEALRVLSRDDKTIYLGLSMVATGLIAAVVWSSLLVDRRDALVIGVLPVRSRTIVRAKLLAVAAYVGLISIGMHLTGAVLFGFLLAPGQSIGFALRGIVAHVVASTTASLFVFATVIAVQGLWLALLGPRLFARASAWLQLALVSIVLLGLIVVPQIAGAVVATLSGVGPGVRPWVLATPPLWFLGLYESVLGTDLSALLALARTALLALAAAVAAAVLSYPLAYRRVMRDAVEHPGGMGRVGLGSVPARWLTALVARHGVTRATMQFYLATLGRVERHRFTLALAAGAAVAWSLPTLLQGRALGAQGRPLPQLALPLAIMALLLVGLHVAAAVPSEIKAGWVFDVAVLPRRRVRAATRRVMMAIGVVPIVSIVTLSLGSQWGWTLAIQHALLCLVAGWLLTEYLIRSADGMPCNRPWRPERANLRTWWPAYLVGFVLFATSSRHALAARALVTYNDLGWYLSLIGALAMAALLCRVIPSNPASHGDDHVDGLNATEVLDLN